MNTINLIIISKIPIDVFYKIMFEHLLLSDRDRCAQTCKGRNRLLMDSPLMWHDIDFRQLKRSSRLKSQLNDKALRRVAFALSPDRSLCPKGIMQTRINYIREMSDKTVFVKGTEKHHWNLKVVNIYSTDEHFTHLLLDAYPNITHLRWAVYRLAYENHRFICRREQNSRLFSQKLNSKHFKLRIEYGYHLSPILIPKF